MHYVTLAIATPIIVPDRRAKEVVPPATVTLTARARQGETGRDGAVTKLTYDVKYPIHTNVLNMFKSGLTKQG